MANRSGSGSGELHSIARELAELREQLARAKSRPGEEEQERLRMRRELAAIQEHLRRLGEKLGRPSD